uniref:Uncharacterized protein n=1 Tax=Catharus ustulatus TaxID=91951 RepID=A0A8C3UTF1_CATUS
RRLTSGIWGSQVTSHLDLRGSRCSTPGFGSNPTPTPHLSPPHLQHTWARRRRHSPHFPLCSFCCGCCAPCIPGTHLSLT